MQQVKSIAPSGNSAFRRLAPPSTTRLSHLSMPARLLVATLRLCGLDNKIPPLERSVLDAIGRVIDAGEDRNKTIDAVNQYSAAALMKTRQPLNILKRPHPFLSHDEHCLLKAASQVANDQVGEASDTLEWYMEPATRKQFIHTLQSLSTTGCFSSLGCHVFTASRFNATIDQTDTVQRHESVLKCNDLSVAERLIINASRLWVRAISLGICSESAIRCLAQNLALPGFAEMIHSLLHETAHHATHQFDMRCLCCDEVSPDEARLLAAIAAIQHGHPTEAVNHLEQWFAPASVLRIMSAAPRIRYAMNELRGPLPLRNWDFESLLQRQMLFNHGNDKAEHNQMH